MESHWDSAARERHWYGVWERAGHFAPDPQGEGSFCILIPPPNVTGTLHMGHGFQVALMDALTRYHRMMGRKTLWQVGTDHAGIATQMVVERQLEAQGSNQGRRELGREAFVQKVWEWKEQSGGIITQQLRRLGASVDWSRERFTMDPEYSEAVLEAFVRLHEAGLVYRDTRLVNWDPQLRTALSDLEVVPEAEQGKLWLIRYPYADGAGDADGGMTVATTRPETMLGDVAVAVHPQDARFAAEVGRKLTLPITGREIPVVADDFVDPEFGTGCVKLTPAHDFHDYEAGRRLGLEGRSILDEGGAVVDGAEAEALGIPAQLRGQDRFAARELVLEMLRGQGLLVEERPHSLQVPRGEKSGAVLEPMLTTQWYFRTQEMGRRAEEAVRSGQVRLSPQVWDNTWYAWLRELRDWCVSRQLWWGHRIPAWHAEDGRHFVGRNLDQARAKAAAEGYEGPLEQDPDVLDTWVSSSLWSFATQGWPQHWDPKLPGGGGDFHPSDVLVTGFDILFFWVMRMVMMTGQLTGEIPFRRVLVHGLIRDSKGRKMSKSKGNVLDPIDLIDGIGLDELVAKRTSGLMLTSARDAIERETRQEFPQGIPASGADALRMTYCSLAGGGRDIHFDPNRVNGYRNFCDKLWNATRFCLDRIAEGPVALPHAQGSGGGLDTAERWILTRLDEAAESLHRNLEQLRLDLALRDFYDFCWRDFCDWYLELAKSRLYDDATDEDAKARIRGVLVAVAEAMLRLGHPFAPFITEELWQRVRGHAGVQGQSLCVAAFPKPGEFPRDEEAGADTRWLQELASAVRSLRGNFRVPPGHRCELLLRGGEERDRRLAAFWAPQLQGLCRLSRVDWLQDGQEPGVCANFALGGLEGLLPLEGVIDVAAELERLRGEVAKLDKEVAGLGARLENRGFVQGAPEQVVEQHRQRLAERTDERDLLRQRLQALGG